MSNSEKRIIEIGGVKMEVDLRYAKRIDELRVGDRVKVLIKEYSNYAVYPGTIVGYEAFEKLPTIIVAYFKRDYASSNINFLYFNAETKDTEIVKAMDGDLLGLDKADALKQFDNEIRKKDNELKDMLRKKQYFLDNFDKYWADLELTMAQMEKQLDQP